MTQLKTTAEQRDQIESYAYISSPMLILLGLADVFDDIDTLLEREARLVAALPPPERLDSLIRFFDKIDNTWSQQNPDRPLGNEVQSDLQAWATAIRKELGYEVE
jgi:hypothetical protein